MGFARQHNDKPSRHGSRIRHRTSDDMLDWLHRGCSGAGDGEMKEKKPKPEVDLVHLTGEARELYERCLEESRLKHKPLIDAIRRAQILTAEDYNVVIGGAGSTRHEPRLGCGSDRAYERRPSVLRTKMLEDAQK